MAFFTRLGPTGKPIVNPNVENTALAICRILLFCGIDLECPPNKDFDKSNKHCNPLIHPFPNQDDLSKLFNNLLGYGHRVPVPRAIKPNTTVITPETQIVDTVECIANLLEQVTQLEAFIQQNASNGTVTFMDPTKRSDLEWRLNRVFNLTTDVLSVAASYTIGHRGACYDRLKYKDITVTLPCGPGGALCPCPITHLCVPGVFDILDTDSSHILSCIRLEEAKTRVSFYQLIGDLGADSQSILSITRIIAFVTSIRMRWFPETVMPDCSLFVTRRPGKDYALVYTD